MLLSNSFLTRADARFSLADLATNVRFWPLADIVSCAAHVRFRKQSGHHNKGGEAAGSFGASASKLKGP